MKKCLVSLLLTTSQLFAQPTPFEDIRLEQGKLYMVARGTRSKQGFISKNFNSSDSNITHIGLAYYEAARRGLKIYNVTTDKKKKNALWVESLQEFISLKDIFYVGLWEYTITQRQFSKLTQLLSTWENRKVTFDYDFDLQNADTSLYCSEFCWKLLYQLDDRSFRSAPIKKVLPNSFYKNMFGKNTLTYIPVDFFIATPRFRKIKEVFIKQP